MRRAALAILAAGFALTALPGPWGDVRVTDIPIYRGYADLFLDGALPYRDVFFEYPPLAAGVIAVPGVAGLGDGTYETAFGIWMLGWAAALVLLTGALAGVTGGDRRTALIVTALFPLLLGAIVRTHLDLVPVVLVAAALLLLCRDRPVAGFGVLGAAVVTKGFPIVVVPIAVVWLVARGRHRVAVRGALACAATVGVVAGAAGLASLDGAWTAVRYQADRPAQVESTAAMVLNGLDAVGLGSARPITSHRSDAIVHPADDVVAALLLAALLASIALLCVSVGRVEGRPPDERRLVATGLGALVAYMVWGEVLSPQFLIWVIPLAGLATAWRWRAVTVATVTAMLLTLVEFPANYAELVDRRWWALAIVAARDACLIGGLAALLAAVAPRGLLHRRGL